MATGTERQQAFTNSSACSRATQQKLGRYQATIASARLFCLCSESKNRRMLTRLET